MADAVKLSTPRVRVVLDDGREVTVQVRNPDYLVWDRTASKHGWPKMDTVPLTWLTFVAWAALRREGQIDQAMTWEDFSEVRAVEVGTVTANGHDPEAVDLGDEGVDPTLPGPVPG